MTDNNDISAPAEPASFAVILNYREDKRLQHAHLPAHLAYLDERVERGELLVSGPWGPGEVPGGMLIYRGADRAAVQAIVDNDPFVINGVPTSVEIHQWIPLVGPLASGYQLES